MLHMRATTWSELAVTMFAQPAECSIAEPPRHAGFAKGSAKGSWPLLVGQAYPAEMLACAGVCAAMLTKIAGQREDVLVPPLESGLPCPGSGHSVKRMREAAMTTMPPITAAAGQGQRGQSSGAANPPKGGQSKAAAAAAAAAAEYGPRLGTCSHPRKCAAARTQQPEQAAAAAPPLILCRLRPASPRLVTLSTGSYL